MPVGPDLPENQEIIDISGEKMKMLASFPTPPEPHDATFMAVSVLRPLVQQTYTPAADAVQAGKEQVVRTGPHAVTVDMTLIRSAYTPDSFQVREGDQVTLKVTNVETIRDMIHGFALPDHNLNIALRAGLHEDAHVRRRQAGRLLVLLHELLQRAASRDARPDGRAAEGLDRHADGLARGGERQGTGCPGRAVDGRQAVTARAKDSASCYICSPRRSRRRRCCAAALGLRDVGAAVPRRDAAPAGRADRDRRRRAARSRRSSSTSACGSRPSCRS